MANWPASLPSATPATHGDVVDEQRAIAGSMPLQDSAPTILSLPWTFTALVTLTAVSGTGYMTTVLVERTISINRVFCHIAVASGNIDVGIYDDDGTSGAPLTRLVSSGAVACPAAGPAAVAVADTVLTPGRYYAAISFNNSTAQFRYGDCQDGSPAITVPRYDTASSHPLPATISGTPTPSSSGSIWFIGLARA